MRWVFVRVSSPVRACVDAIMTYEALHDWQMCGDARWKMPSCFPPIDDDFVVFQEAEITIRRSEACHVCWSSPFWQQQQQMQQPRMQMLRMLSLISDGFNQSDFD